MSGKASSALIQQLLAAEEQAEKIVARARENRVRKLKDAQESAEAEIRLFKEREQAIFEKEMAAKYGGQEDTSYADLEALTKQQVEAVQRDYKAHRNEVIDFLLKRTVKVEIHLEEVQKRFLIERAAGNDVVYN